MPLRLNDARIFCEWDGFSQRVLTRGCKKTIIRPDTPMCGEIAVWLLGQEPATNCYKECWSVCDKCAHFTDFIFMKRWTPINSNPEIANRMPEILRLVRLERKYQRKRSKLDRAGVNAWLNVQKQLLYKYVTRDIRWCEYLVDQEEKAMRDAKNNEKLQEIIRMYAEAQTLINEKIANGLARQTAAKQQRKERAQRKRTE